MALNHAMKYREMVVNLVVIRARSKGGAEIVAMLSNSNYSIVTASKFLALYGQLVDFIYFIITGKI